MKTKIILFLTVCAIITLSFSFVSSNKNQNNASAVKADTSAPIGGLSMGDEL